MDEPQAVWKLLSVLAKLGNSFQASELGQQDTGFRTLARFRFPPITHEQLEKQKTAPWKLNRNLYIHLPLVEKGGWRQQPVARASFESQEGHSVFRLQVGILVEGKTPEGTGGSTKPCHGIGIRFDSSEGPGDHSYYHAQFFSTFDRDGQRLDDCPEWLPDSHPAIPIPAENAVDTICCALKSLYGARSSVWTWIADEVKRRGPFLDGDTRGRIKYWSEKCPSLSFR
jgi:hypothetical protein